MTVEALLEAYQGIPLPHVVHWRTATSGGILPEMTHPYKMTEDSELFTQGDLDVSVLFHNGIISDWQASLLNLVTSGQIKRMPKGPMNDTRMNFKITSAELEIMEKSAAFDFCLSGPSIWPLLEL